MLRYQLGIEYLVKLVQFCWERYFNEDAEQVKRTRDPLTGHWGGKWAGVNRMCQAAYQLLKLVVTRNRRSADALQV